MNSVASADSEIKRAWCVRGGLSDERIREERNIEAAVCAAGGAVFGERIDCARGKHVCGTFTNCTGAGGRNGTSESFGGEPGGGRVALPATFEPVWRAIQRRGKGVVTRDEPGDTSEPRQGACIFAGEWRCARPLFETIGGTREETDSAAGSRASEEILRE
jgi:hypothetical protein